MNLVRTLQANEIKAYLDNCLGIDIGMKTRKRNYVYARAVYFKLCKKHTRMSLYDIGSTLGMDHSSVIHAISNVFPLAIKYDSHLQDLYYDYKFSHKHETESIFENYSRLLRENVELRGEIKEIKKESLLDRRFLDLYNEIPEAKKEEVYTKLDTIVKVAKIFHEKDILQS